MRFLFSILFLFGLVSSSYATSPKYITSENVQREFMLQNEFAKFKTQFEKSYSTQQEEEYRYGIFVDNLERAASLNEGQNEAVFGITKFMDMDPSEFKRHYLNYRGPVGEDVLERMNWPVQEPAFTINPEADNVDWRSKGAVTAVKDQGNCGSCWAFSAAEEIESMWYLKHGVNTPLSPQQIVSCDKVDLGCNGGDLPSAYDYVETNGLQSESSYPYTSGTSGSTGTCKYSAGSVIARISGYSYATPACFDSCNSQDESTLLNNLASTGPVAICVYAEPWQFYISGILSSSCSHTYSTLDHCVQLVGYQTGTTPYWLIRNSWGTSWGNAGYIYVKYGSNLCGVADEAMFVAAA